MCGVGNLSVREWVCLGREVLCVGALVGMQSKAYPLGQNVWSVGT